MARKLSKPSKRVPKTEVEKLRAELQKAREEIRQLKVGLPSELLLLRTASQVTQGLPLTEQQRARFGRAQKRIEEQLETTARRLRDQLERGLVSSGLATRIGDTLLAPVPVRRGMRETISWRDVRSGRFATRPEDHVQRYSRLKALQQARDVADQMKEEGLRGQEPDEKIVSAGDYTRVRASFVVTRGTRTECTANAFIKAPGIRSLAESIQALAAAFTDAAKTGLQGSAATFGAGWEGLATMGNGDCAGTISDVLRQFAEAPRPDRIQAIVNSLFDLAGVSFNGEVTISYRKVVRYISRRGNERERMETVPDRESRRFVFGVGIRQQEDVDLGKGLYQ